MQYILKMEVRKMFTGFNNQMTIIKCSLCNICSEYNAN